MISQTFFIKNRTIKWPVYWLTPERRWRILAFSSKVLLDWKKENPKTKPGIHEPCIDMTFNIYCVKCLSRTSRARESLMKPLKKYMITKDGNLPIYSSKGLTVLTLRPKLNSILHFIFPSGEITNQNTVFETKMVPICSETRNSSHDLPNKRLRNL